MQSSGIEISAIRPYERVNFGIKENLIEDL